jgi:hypothetical protein
VSSTVDDAPLLEADTELRIDSELGGVSAVIATADGRIVRDENALDVWLSDPAAGILEVRAFMPAHGHGTVPPDITHDEEAFHIENLMLFMPGRWDVTLELEVSGEADRVNFSVEVP